MVHRLEMSHVPRSTPARRAVEVPGRKGPILFEVDEHNRPGTTLETLAKLRPAFRDEGTITAGNAPGLNSGAAAMVLADERWAEKRGLAPSARLVAYGIGAVEPGLFGLGPIPAVKQALARAGWTLGDVERIEINEAFAAIVLAVVRELGLPEDIVNVEGGAIMGISHALFEEVIFNESGITQDDWISYPIPTMSDIPEIKVVLLNNPKVGAYGGGSEAANALAAPAIAVEFKILAPLQFGQRTSPSHEPSDPRPLRPELRSRPQPRSLPTRLPRHPRRREQPRAGVRGRRGRAAVHGSG